MKKERQSNTEYERLSIQRMTREVENQKNTKQIKNKRNN